MSRGSHSSHRRSKFALLILAAGAALVLTQCRMVGDQVTSPAGGLGLARQENHGNCISECAKAYADSNKVESALHVANVKACGGDAACLATEEARFETAKERIASGRKDCFDGCHHQGGGAGGR